MRRTSAISGLHIILIFLFVALSRLAQTAAAADVNLSQFTNFTFNNPIGIDFHEPNGGNLIMSVNWITGEPHNLDLVDISSASATQFSTLHGLTEELKIATVRTTAACQQFPVGDVFTGNGQPGEIVRLDQSGNIYTPAINNPGTAGAPGGIAHFSWVKLPGSLPDDLLRGSIFVDRFCAFGGDLIVVTSDEPPFPTNGGGAVWRVKLDGTAQLLTRLTRSVGDNCTAGQTCGLHLEGVITLPVDSKYGPWSGKIIAGYENENGNLTRKGQVWAIGADGTAAPFDLSFTLGGVNHPVKPEDIDLIEPGGFFGVAFADKKILAAPPSDFTPFVGDILITQEYPCGTNAGCGTSTPQTGLYVVRFVGSGGNAAGGLFSVTPLNFAGSSPVKGVNQWEHVTFTPIPVAKISIAPNATNEIGQPHTFTVTLQKDLTGSGNSFVPAANEHVTVTLTNSNGANFTNVSGTCTNAGPNTNAAGQCTITFTSPTPGKVTGHASSTLTFGATTITVQTDGVAPNSGDAVKTFVDANIQITPATATNPVNTNHILTGHVNINDGSGIAYANAPAGTSITFSLTNSGGASAAFVGPNSCTTIGTTGSCTVTINSSTVGSTTIKASTTVNVAGVSLTRTTGDGKVGDSADANKKWGGAKITIEPNATNEINASHTFIVTVSKDLGAGFVPAEGVHVNFTLTDSNGASHTAATGTCTNGGPNTDVNGKCTIIFSSPTAGKVTGHASATVPIDSGSVTVETNGTAPNSGDAVKTFVDANIQITPQNATNPVNTNHVLTGHVNINAGDGLGYVNAPAGTSITFSLTNSGGASAAFVGPNSCTTIGTTGSCTVTINSSTVGSTTIKASTTVNVAGVSLTRTTGDGKAGDSADANKKWVNANIQITPATATNPINTNHVLTITVNALNGTIDVGPHTATASIVSGVGSFVGSPTCTYTGGAASASCTVTITSAVIGTTEIQATSDIPVNGQTITRTTNTAVNTAAGGSDNAEKHWITTGKTIGIGPSSMEGAIRIDAGDFVNGGYSFKTNFTGNITIAATVSITGACLDANKKSLGTTDTITVPLNTLNGTVFAGGIPFAAVAGSDWKPTGDANSVLSWQGSIIAPSTLCGGNGAQLDASKGATFDAQIFGAPAGGKVTFRFKFRDPAAKGKPNTDCLDTTDPNRNKADVCGASWSSTKTDP